MTLKEYLKTHSASELARAVGVHQVLISQWKHGRRPVPVDKCVRIERATGGLVTRRDLRPRDWHLIWPELVERYGPPEQEAA